MRFGALRLVAGFQVVSGALLVIAAIYIILVIFGADVATPQLHEMLNTPIGLLTAIALFLVGLGWIAFGELIQVIMQIEINTRKDG
jgi:hypothetical protein